MDDGPSDLMITLVYDPEAFVAALEEALRALGTFAADVLGALGFVAEPDQLSYDTEPDHCWADVWDAGLQDYRSCNRQGGGELGLCWQHCARLATVSS
jgi:hypothetical protein